MTAIHQLNPTIDVYVKGKGWAKAFFLIDYSDQTNSMFKVRLYDTGRILNVYDDELLIAANQADGETDQIPEDWKPKVAKATKKV